MKGKKHFHNRFVVTEEEPIETVGSIYDAIETLELFTIRNTAQSGIFWQDERDV